MKNNAKVTLSGSTEIYANDKIMSKTDLIIQSVTMLDIKRNELKGLSNAISNGTGLAGFHGGLGDSFRNSTEYQYIVGGQFVAHPGGHVFYDVNIIDKNDFITKNINDFNSKITLIEKKAKLEDNLSLLNINLEKNSEEIIKGINLLRLGTNPVKINGKDIYSFIKDSDLAGFNSDRFDIPLLVEELLRVEIDFDFKKMLTIDVQTIFHKMEKRTLSAALKFYCNRENEKAHSAMNDTRATYDVLNAQLEKYSDLEPNVKFLNEFPS